MKKPTRVNTPPTSTKTSAFDVSMERLEAVIQRLTASVGGTYINLRHFGNVPDSLENAADRVAPESLNGLDRLTQNISALEELANLSQESRELSIELL